MLTGKGMLRAGYGNKKGKGMLRAGYGNKKGKGMLRAGYGSKALQFKNFFNFTPSFNKLWKKTEILSEWT